MTEVETPPITTQPGSLRERKINNVITEQDARTIVDRLYLPYGDVTEERIYDIFNNVNKHAGYYYMFYPLAMRGRFDILERVFPNFLPRLDDSIKGLVYEVSQEIRRDIMNLIVKETDRETVFKFLQWLPITERTIISLIMSNNNDGITEKVFEIMETEPEQVSPLDEYIKYKSYLIDKAINNIHTRNYDGVINTVRSVFGGEWNPRWMYQVTINGDLNILFKFNEEGCEWPLGMLEMIAKYNGIKQVIYAIDRGVPIENENKNSSPADYLISDEDTYTTVSQLGLNITYTVVYNLIRSGCNAELINRALQQARKDCGISAVRESRILVDIAELREELFEKAVYEWGMIPTYHLRESKKVNMENIRRIFDGILKSRYRI